MHAIGRLPVVNSAAPHGLTGSRDSANRSFTASHTEIRTGPHAVGIGHAVAVVGLAVDLREAAAGEGRASKHLDREHAGGRFADVLDQHPARPEGLAHRAAMTVRRIGIVGEVPRAAVLRLTGRGEAQCRDGD